MPTNDFLRVGEGAGANVDSQANFAAGAYRTNGFVAGLAKSFQANKMWRQASAIGNIIGELVGDVLGLDFLDNGDDATQKARVLALIQGAAGQPGFKSVAFSATPSFNCADPAVNPLHSVFQIVLTGNVTGSSVLNMKAGQLLTLIVIQDVAGGHTFVPPVPMDTIDGTPNQRNMQTFLCLGDGTTFIPFSPLQLSI